MNGFSSSLTQAMHYDFQLKFWVGTQYTDLWQDTVINGSWGGADGYDFPDWTNVNFIGSDWREFTSKIDGVAINATQGTIGKWTVTLSGVGYDPVLLARERTVACLMQARHGGTPQTWSPSWGLCFIGAITGFTPEASYATNGAFKLEISGVTHYMDIKDLPPQSWGKVNIAEGKSCSWRSTLLDPSQLDNNGEFVGSQVSLGAENAVDGVVYGAPACSATPPLADQYERNLTGNRGRIREVYLWPPAGYGPQYQWISVTADTLHMLTLGKGRFGSIIGDDENQTCFYYTNTPYPKSPGGNANEVGIFCYNRTCVEELFDISGAAWVVEWGKEMPNQFISPTQDYIIVQGTYKLHTPICDYMKWSTTNPTWTVADSVVADFGNCNGNWGSLASNWVGNCINPSTITPGQSLARKKWSTDKWILDADTNTPADWTFNDLPMPLAFTEGKDPQWCTLDLGSINCKVDANFTTGTYPATLLLDTTFGLSGSGKVIIGQRILNYDVRTPTSLHITGGEAGAYSITAGAQVYQYDAVSAATKFGYRVSKIKFWRKPGLSHIRLAELHASTLTGTPREPSYDDDPGDQIPWWLDWSALGDGRAGMKLMPPASVVDSGLVEVDLPFDAANPEKDRFTQLMLNVHRMHGNGRAATDPLYVAPDGYFLLNEIEVFTDEVITRESSTLTEATAASVIRDILVTELGLPAAKVKVSDNLTAMFNEQVTARSKYTDVIGGLAASYGLAVTEALDGTVHITQDPWWPSPPYLAEYVSQYAFTKNTLSTLNERAGPARGVAQAKINARDPEGKFSFVGVYPESPGAYGDIVGGNDTYVCASQAVANQIAEAVYRRADHNVVVDAVCTAPATWLRPNMLVSIDWPYEDGSARHALWVVTGVNHNVVLGSVSTGDTARKEWTTSFTAQAFTYSGTMPRPEKPK